ncbi:serine/threonine protein kinase DUN1 TDEL_0G02820 [Torulaspora delbrueckii]|uniref:DNA damage response protein kinase DUN1 n=1 Tax=Torulaspora delbrueckii TaxID=4950 RepID=G8ZZ24_TORDE|nr:hypothetical protein TDEL_0G02820 [Torulaspora delbrueckii]CCE93649.1 hypothetical protein TDEL_0G02820 [Torulaspora delbrueckii]
MDSSFSSKRGYPDQNTTTSKRVNTSQVALARLVNLIPGKDKNFELVEKPVITVGRSRQCDIMLNESDISTVHCEFYLIQMDVDGVKRTLLNIVDKSRNGTFINGSRLVKKDKILKNGDRLVLGKSCSFLFKYIFEDDERNVSIEQPKSDSVFEKPKVGFSNSQSTLRRLTRPRPQSVFDNYVVGKELGVGHYATVKEGINKKTEQIVAIKIFHPQLNDDQKKNKQFKEETDILMRVKHSNIVKLLDSYVETVSKSQIQKYLVLEKIDDGELFDRILRKTSLRQDETKALFKQILTGLQYLHGMNIIHRDIKPENILLNITKRSDPKELQKGPWDADEIDIQVKIADFGLAKFTGEMQFTNTLCGTPSYVAPEVLRKTDYSSKVDMWSAGVLLYVCLCGFPPFSDTLGPPSLKEQIAQGIFAFYSPYWDEIDDSVLHLISHLLVVNPTNRYSVEDTIRHPWFDSDVLNKASSHDIKRQEVSPSKSLKTYSELSQIEGL